MVESRQHAKSSMASMPSCILGASLAQVAENRAMINVFDTI